MLWFKVLNDHIKPRLFQKVNGSEFMQGKLLNFKYYNWRNIYTINILAKSGLLDFNYDFKRGHQDIHGHDQAQDGQILAERLECASR